MRRNISLLAMLAAVLATASSAFTLDAVGYAGSELCPDPVAIFVPGYGELLLEASVGSAIVVNSAYRNDDEHGEVSPVFDEAQAIKIEFNQKDSGNLIDEVPQQGDEPSSSHLENRNPDVVPESASAVLGLIGVAIFIFLHRR